MRLKLNRSNLAAVVLLSVISGCYSVNLRTANSYYEENAYTEAIKKYEKALGKKRDEEAMTKLADSYRQTGNTEKAEEWYKEVIGINSSLPVYKFYYAEALMKNGKAEEAKSWFTEYLKTTPTDEKAKRMLASCDSAGMLYTDTTQYALSFMPVNMPEISSFSPAYYRSGIVFLSDRSAPGKSKIKSPYTGKKYLDLFYSEKKPEGTWSEPEMLKGGINGIYDEGPAAFSKDFNTVYFTRNDYSGNVLNKNKRDFNLLKIYKSMYSLGEWNYPSALSVNSNDYSMGHPALSRDGSAMYFVADMPWGYGGTDVYMIKQINGNWTNPENLGANVNSPGDEMFPFLQNDSTLYFSSDGNYGLGGLDVFMSIYNGKWSSAVNLKYPVNTPKDDFGFIIDSTDQNGFLSSDRQGDGDKLYSFIKYPPNVSVSGTIADKKTSAPLEKTKIIINDQAKNKDTTALAANGGKYYIPLALNKNYKMTISKPGYYTQYKMLTTAGIRTSQNLSENFQLQKINTGEKFIKRNITFKKQTWNIIPETARTLDSVYNWLKENPQINIEISCHTESRGNDKDNLTLSQQRADALAAYLFSKGIQSSRITAKGYGETKLLNGCINGILCIEEDHAINNRTEIKITSLKPG